jgi:IstB-like ATP binding protein
MAEAFTTELARSGEASLSFAERCGLLVDRQWAFREEARLARRLKKADLKDAGLRSSVVTSRLPVSEWHSLIADASIADALPGRLVHRAVRIELKGESLRKEAPRRSPQLT